MDHDPQTRAAELTCWTGVVVPEPVSGGLTNSNFLVEFEGRRHFVRIGNDIPLHGVMRFNELAASRAAHAAGVSPEVVHHEDGAIVSQFIDGRTLEAADVRNPDTLARIIPLIRRCHQEIPRHLRGPALVFWVFHMLRDYAHTLRAARSRFASELPRFLEVGRTLEAAVGPVSLVFGHNDLLASNIIDDGRRLWLVDWDYAGFNSPLFDLGGLASNNELTTQQEEQLLDGYFEGVIPDDLEWRYAAMKCASLLREAMWGMVSEQYPALDVDYAAYAELNLGRFEAAWAEFERV